MFIGGGLHMRSKKNNIKNAVSEILELPKDIMLDLPKVTMVGKMEVHIENHKGIIEYSREIIRINTGEGILKITGKTMNIKNIMTEELTIAGEIISVEFK